MDLVVKKISNLVEQQFPAFYRSEGPTFVEFVKSYYEWLEQDGNSLQRSRSVFELIDIDETLEDFLFFFQRTYLYGIPFEVIINKRFLLKHVLDVYRSKGTIQAYRLLFKLIYDLDIDVYLPGRDILRSSDGDWIEPRYLEITNVAGTANLVGQTILGVSSRTKAVVESFVTEPLNQNIIASVYISNITPKGGEFIIGEKIIKASDITSTNLPSIVAAAPAISGSLDSITVINGGRNFKVGDLLKITRRDIVNGAIIATGTEGVLRVTETFRGRGRLDFNIIHPGFGYTANSETFIYNNEEDTTGTGAAFDINNLSNIRSLQYNNEMVTDYLDVTLNASSYGLSGNTAANLTSTIEECLTYSTAQFGSILSLTDINVGNNYTNPPYVFVRATHLSNTLPGNVAYSSASANITGTGTEFTTYFANDSVIYITATGGDSLTSEYQVIKQVVNNTVLVLYGPPTMNSTSTADHQLAADILPSNFAPYESDVLQLDDSTAGRNANVYAFPAFGNNVISKMQAVNSGKGYIDGEFVKMYLFGAVDDPTILNGGEGYANGEILIFSGGQAFNLAQGTVATDANGTITSIVMTSYGSGYTSVPTITVRTSNGTGASITTVLSEFNTIYEVTGTVNKAGIGKQQGYFATTNGFLNSDKRITDSYFYQDFSYQIKVASSLAKYRDILYNTFHIAGTELFGQYLLITEESSPAGILYDSNSAITAAT